MFWIGLAVILLVLGTVLFAWQQRLHDEQRALAFKRRPAVFSPSERGFMEVLELATGKDFRVLGKVRASELLAPQDGTSYRVRSAAQTTLDRLHFDFVLCKPRNLTALCAIVLNNRTQKHKQTQKHGEGRQRFLVDACHSAGLPLIEFDAHYTYSPAEVSRKIAEAIASTLHRDIGQIMSTFGSNGTSSFSPDPGVTPVRMRGEQRETGTRSRR